MMKRFSALLLLIILVFSLSSCKDSSDGSVDFGDYIIEEESTLINDAVEYETITADYSWISAYALSYSFFDTQTGESIITEGKCGKYYQSIDTATNIISFLSQEDGYVLQYMLNSNTRNGTVAIVTDGTVADSVSGFVQMSFVKNPYFPSLTNVTKVGSDFIADRPATRYKQVQTENGVETMIAYIWIDDEFGFASKCEVYDAQTEAVLKRWELLDFTQNVTEEGVKINVDAYDIVSE